jgi:hypothetical protein
METGVVSLSTQNANFASEEPETMQVNMNIIDK